MATFPPINAFTSDDAESEDNHRQDLDDLLAATRQLIGAAGEEAIDIASGSITPTRGTVKVDTQASAATDDLDNIVTTNLPDGSLLLLRIADNGRHVVVQHNAGGAGQISLVGGVALELNLVTQRLLLQRVGADWTEAARLGAEEIHIVGDPGEPAFTNSWVDSGLTNGEPSFQKDDSGYVQLRGRPQRNPLTNNSIFTLPVGYRPLASRIFPVRVADTVDTQVDLVSIGSDGTVNYLNISGKSANGTVHLDPIRFFAEQ